MRDVIWTVIIIWLVYKVLDLFKTVSAKKSYVNSNSSHSQPQQGPANTAPHSKKDIKSAIQKHLNNDGEYVDFEEMK